ncbi:ABC transporter ATP-binding protein [Noviherbaspirillum sp.]|uniref:ABC transporter ATP-binding protein n=1 Tax=Noviherbaspirillum sp. TaxID=1926288 RepID=UPI002D56E3D9|nr:ABC transporter ATP-binding protein [Noviherbaspirillum sp.]HZW21736.1 ABC transporter ATP-binding protein [Noviherbaspirillum sp.]
MILRVDNLSVRLPVRGQLQQVVRRASFSLAAGEVLGVVGESGCGKSITNLAIMGLLPGGAQVSADRFELCGRDLLALKKHEWPALRGSAATMIFQNPVASLNPSLTVGAQLIESVRRDDPGGGRAQCVERAIDLLDRVGIDAPRRRMGSYPHELSGGMAQRVMIALALACRPALLIADEPTTALDVGLQAQILDLLAAASRDSGMAVILVSHDIGVARRYADRIQVMYAGEIVESGPAGRVTHDPAHPYTRALLHSLPGRAGVRPKMPLAAIPGTVPSVGLETGGCRFAPRCAHAQSVCHGRPAPLRAAGAASTVRCHF